MFEYFGNKQPLMILSIAALFSVNGCDKVKTTIPDDTTTKNIDISGMRDDLYEGGTPVLLVNGSEILDIDILNQLKPLISQIQKAQGQIPEKKAFEILQKAQQSITDQLVINILITDAIKAEGISISSEKVNELIETQKPELMAGQTFDEYLAERGTNLEAVKKDITKKMEIEALTQLKTADVVDATEAEALEVYNEVIAPGTVTASHVLIKFAPDASDTEKAEKKQQLEKIRGDILAGTISFADAAKTYSEDPGSKDNDGEYKKLPKGQTEPAFDAAIFSQPIGEIGEIIETSYGFHLVLVSERHPVEKTFDEIKEGLIAQLTTQKKTKVWAQYLAELKNSAEIKPL